MKKPIGILIEQCNYTMTKYIDLIAGECRFDSRLRLKAYFYPHKDVITLIVPMCSQGEPVQ